MLTSTCVRASLYLLTSTCRHRDVAARGGPDRGPGRGPAGRSRRRPARRAPPAPGAGRRAGRQGVALRRPVPGGLRAHLPGADRLRGLPQPLPRAGVLRRHGVRRAGQLRRRAHRRQVLGRRRCGSCCSSWSRCRSCSASRCVGRAGDRQRPAPRRRASSGSIIFLPYAVPGVVAVLMWGFMYGTNFGLAADLNDLFGTVDRSRSASGWMLAVDRQHRDLGVRGLQHADLLLRAAHGARRRSTRRPRSTAPERSGPCSRSRSRHCAAPS